MTKQIKLNEEEKKQLLSAIRLGSKPAAICKISANTGINEKTKIDDEVIAQNFEDFVERTTEPADLFHFLLKIGFDYNFPIQYRVKKTTLKRMIESGEMPEQREPERIKALLAEREKLAELCSRDLERYIHEEECFHRFLKKSYWLKKSQERQEKLPADQKKLYETLKNMSGALGPSKETTKLMRNVVKQFKAKKQKEKQ